MSGGSLCSAPREQVGAQCWEHNKGFCGTERPKGRAHLDNREGQGQSRGVTSQTWVPSCPLARPICWCAGLRRARTLLCQGSSSMKKSSSGVWNLMPCPLGGLLRVPSSYWQGALAPSPRSLPSQSSLWGARHSECAQGRRTHSFSHAFLVCSDLSPRREIRSSSSVTPGGCSQEESTGPLPPPVFSTKVLKEPQGLVLGPAQNGGGGLSRL